jgi:WD40 repeat protein/beta-lactamase regulating signal transducer with metallopeptidase domain
MTILIWVWLAGTLAAFTLSAVRVHRFRRAMRWATPASAAIQQEAAQIARRIGLRDHPRVWLVSGAVSPMLWAIFGHTRLLFPSRLLEDLAPVARRALLLHELAHLRRRDHWVRLLEATATILYWWHPVVWWARREIQAAEETCCDSWVVAGMPEDRGVYAAALIETDRFLSESHLALPALASGVQGFMLMKRRVTMIMRMRGEGPTRLSPVAWAGLLTFAAICLPLVPTVAQVRQSTESPVAEAIAAPVEAIAPVVAAEVQPQSASLAAATACQELAGIESLPHRGVGRRARHIWSLSFSPDGRKIAVGSGEWDLAGELHLLDVATGQVLARERVRQGVASVAFSPDGTLVASCSWHGHLRMHKTDGLVLVHDIPLQSVARVAFSPDGKTIATAAEGWSKDAAPGRRVELWDVATGTQRRLLDGDLFRLHCVAFSRDGNLVAAGGGRWEQNRMGEVRLWNAQTGKQTARLVGHQGPVFGLAFSPDGKTVATGALDATIRFWDPATGQQKREIQAHDSWVEGLSFSPDGKMLASSSLDGAGKLWDVATGQLLTTLTGHEGWVRQARFSPDGTTLATAGEDGKVQFWDVARRERRQTIVPPDWLTDPAEPVTCVAYSPDGKSVATAHDSKTVRLRDPATGDVRTLLVGHEGAVSSVAYSADGKTLATASCDKTVKLWDAATGQARTTLEGHTDWVLAAVFSPDGKMLASCGKDKTVRLWDLATGRELARLEGHIDLVRAVAFSPDGKRLASTGADHCVKVWDTDARKEVFSLTGAAGTAVVFSPDGTTLASPMVEDRPGQLSAVYLWDMKTAKLRNALTGQRTTVWSLAFSPGGQTLASGSLDGKIVLWDVASGKSLQEVWSHQGAVTSLAFSPDSRTLASGGADATLNLWDTKLRPTPPLLTFLPGHGAVRSVAFSPDGRTLATSGEDGKARLWAFPALECQRELGDDVGPVTSVVFSPDGHRLALGGPDFRITLWDARDGRRLAELKGHTREVTSLQFSPDGKRLASSAHDSEVRVWDVEAGREVLKLKHPGASQCIDWSPDGQTLCAGVGMGWEADKEFLAILWNAQTGQEIARLTGHQAHVTLVRFSPDGKRLATGASDTRLLLWDVATRKVLGSMTTHWGVPDARFLPDGQTLAVAMHAGRFDLWDLSTFREAVRYEGHGPFTVAGLYGWGIYGVAVSPDGSVVASTDSRGLVKFWPTFRGTRDPTNAAASLAKMAAATGSVMPPPGAAPAPSGLIYSVAAQKSGVLFGTFSPDGKLLAAGGEDGTITLLEAEKGRVLKTLPVHEGAVLTGAFSPDGRQFATGGSGNSVKRWDVDSGQQIGSFSGPAVLTRTVAFSGDGQSLVSANDAGLFRRWETETGRELSKVDLSPMTWMALSPDGKLAAAANWDGTVGVSNLQDLKPVAVLKGHFGCVLSAAFSPDGRLLVSTSASLDPKLNVKLWDTGTWKERAALEGHCGYVHCATFSPEGKTIATCGADLTIRLWNAADGKPLKTLRGHTASVVFVRFSSDGRRLASASLDGTVKVWTP